MTDRRFRNATYPMSIEDKDELAQEFAEFGYRETFDPNDADRRNFYKVEKWDAAELHIEALIKSDLRQRKEPPTARSLYVTPRHPRPRTLAAPCAALIANEKPRPTGFVAGAKVLVLGNNT